MWESTFKRVLRPINPSDTDYFACFCSRRWRSIVRAICSCSSAILVKPFLRRSFARARCHSGIAWASSWRSFLESSSIDMFCPIVASVRKQGGRSARWLQLSPAGRFSNGPGRGGVQSSRDFWRMSLNSFGPLISLGFSLRGHSFPFFSPPTSTDPGRS